MNTVYNKYESSFRNFRHYFDNLLVINEHNFQVLKEENYN